MGALDEYGEAIASALDAAGIRWCIFAGDGIYGYEIRVVDENWIPARMRMSPGEVAALLGVEWPEPFPKTRP